MEADGDSAGCGRIELRCCNFCGFNHPPYTCSRSVESNIQPFSAGGARQISLILKISCLLTCSSLSTSDA